MNRLNSRLYRIKKRFSKQKGKPKDTILNNISIENIKEIKRQREQNEKIQNMYSKSP